MSNSLTDRQVAKEAPTMLSLNNIRISLSKISFATDLKRIAISMLTKCSHAFTSPFVIICHVMTPIVEASFSQDF
jgi:hypothetical protein